MSWLCILFGVPVLAMAKVWVNSIRGAAPGPLGDVIGWNGADSIGWDVTDEIGWE